jgi:hypothetical protein
MREARERIVARGHRLVLGLHPTTFEITKEEELTPQGDCIIGVGADKGPADLSMEFRELMARDDAILLTRLSCGETEVEVRARGSSGLAYTHPTDLVWRRSTYTCGRTMAIRADRTARSLPRELMESLREGRPLIVDLRVTVP